MSKSLLIAFTPGEVGALAGFGEALGQPYEIVLLEDAPPADALAPALLGEVGQATHIAALSSMASKDGLARLAGLMDAAMVTDVLAVQSPTQFVRPMVAGSLVATVEVLSLPVVMTVRPAGFPKVEAAASPRVLGGLAASATVRERTSGKQGGRPDLGQARVVVSGGRPLKDAETFERVIGGLADKLGGAAGATRAAVDSGIAPNELQVGQTGKVVAPDLYIAAGVSGSTQHMAGIKDSKVIVAINKDPDAPIFEVADYGLVGDLYEVIPELMAKL